MPLASFSSWNQTIKPRPCSGGLNDQQPYSPRQRLGFFMPCDDCAPEGQKHFPPNGNAFALSGRRLLCYPCSPGCCPGLVAHCPFQGRFRQNDYCWWALQMSVLDTPGLQIWLNDYLSNNIRILTPKNRGYWSRKGHSVEKTPFFAVFGKALTDRWLRDYLSVNGQFTKYEFARGKVSLHERPCFVVWKVMFGAMKHGLWCGQS